MTLRLLHTTPDPRLLAVWAARHRLIDAQGDLGYALHGLLRAAFGECAPKPFRYVDAEQGLLAYTTQSVDALREAAMLAPPDVADALGLDAQGGVSGLSLRELPSRWPPGHLLSFEVRVRPVIREGATGREQDAFLYRAKQSIGTVLERQTVYVQWLREQVARQGGAEIVSARMTRFRLLEVLRQSTRRAEGETRGRKRIGGPDAVLSGQLRVTDPAAFAQLLAHGIGRHRAFGFGLLLLRPARH